MRLLRAVPWLIRAPKPRPKPSGGTVFVDVNSLDADARTHALIGLDRGRVADADRVVLVTPSGYGWLVKDRHGPERSLTPRQVERMRAGLEEPRLVKIKWTHHPSQRLSATGYKAGRFGGGWQWCVGVKAARRCVIFELLFGSLRVTW